MANSLAFKSNFRTKMSAVIVKGGNILSVGHNSIPEKTDPKNHFGCSLHAEMDALQSCRADMTGAKMYVYRFLRKDGTLASSEPCDLCKAKLKDSGISTVIYVDASNNLKKAKVSEW